MTDIDRITDRIAELNHPAEPEPVEEEHLSRDDLKTMTPQQIVDAYDGGELDPLLGRVTPGDAELITRATHKQTITSAEARRLAQLDRHDLIAALPHDRITND